MKQVVAMIMMATATCMAGLGEPREVAFKASLDGTRQLYMELLPEPFDKTKSYDLIIGLHGHGSDRNQFARDPRSECEAFRRFAGSHAMIAVTPDYRARTSWMGPEAEADMVQLIKDLKKEYRINRVFLAGGSMGGSAALTFAALHPELVDGVTAMNALANHVTYNQFQDAIAASFGARGHDVAKEKRKRSAEYYPDKLTMPVAFTVGGRDTAVPGESAMRLYKALKARNRKVWMLERPEGGHVTTLEDGLQALEFMLKNAEPKGKR